MKKYITLLLLVLLMLSLCACSAPTKPADEKPEVNETANQEEGGTRILKDCKGREIALPNEVKSIVCCGVGALRYTCYMQGYDLVAGVEDYEKEQSLSRLYNYVNFDKFKDLPVIGKNGEPFIEEIVKVSPDVIVMTAFVKMDPDELQSKTGIPVFVVPGSDSALDEGAYETFKLMGELYNKQDRAEELTNYLKSFKEDLDKRTKDIKEEEKPTVYVGGVSFKGRHGFEGTEANYGPLALINARNLADETDQKGPFNIDVEKVLEWDPDIIFIDFGGLSLIAEDYKTNADYYNSLKAVKEGDVYSQIAFRSCASNLDTALADAVYAATIIYPEQFKDIDPIEKTGEIFEMLLGTNPYIDLKNKGFEFRPIVLSEEK